MTQTRSQWSDLFAPVVAASAAEERPQQAQLGQAIIDAIAGKTHLVAEAPTGTGKSFSALIPIIGRVHEDKEFRAVISTETTALQDQYVKKDLPFLHKVYGGFSFCVLKGRNHYFCPDRAKVNSRADKSLIAILRVLEPVLDSLGDGEKPDIEKRLGRKLDDETWGLLSGSQWFCNDNGCDTKKCFAMKARARALASNIVVANHAILKVDTDMKAGQNSLMVDGMLGDFGVLVVDEAHTLEAVLVDGWTESVSAWELREMGSSVSKGFDKATSFAQAPASMGYKIQQVQDDLDFVLDATQHFFELTHANEPWERVSVALCEQRLVGTQSDRMLRAMEAFEIDVPKRLEGIQASLADVNHYLHGALNKAIDQEIKGVRRDINKALRASKMLREFFDLFAEAASTRDGLVVKYGVPYAVVLDGYVSRDGTKRARLRTVPLDISKKASDMWKGHASVLLSATLTDLTTGNFDYVAASLGFPQHTQLKTSSPFAYREQQAIYITPGKYQAGSERNLNQQYAFEELVELINAADGRTLVLFTAKSELEEAAEKLFQLHAAGEFPYRILVQEKGVDKKKLVDDFKADKHSVLLGSKSMMTGIDVPGETLSQVVIAKWPNPRYDVVCRQQVAWWRRRGYPKWYEREALTLFSQSAGRLIRTTGDRGVVSIIDQRVTRASERVYQTARIGVDALGSGVIRSADDVRRFLAG